MYNVSEQFHSAVFENSPETQIMFRFTDGTVLTNEDIHLASGIKVTEAANYEEELTIGACLSSTLSATFMNYHGLLSGYAFGECEVSLGVKTDESVFIPSVANVTAIRGFGTGGAVVYTGHSTAPYLKANGVATTEQPSFPVESVVIYEGGILCIGSAGQTWTSSAFSATVNTGDFMKQKYVAMAKAHTGFDFTGDVLHVFSESGLVEKYEFAKLGVFKIDTPKKRNTNLIAVTTAYDRMRLFDVQANDFLGGLTYPITLGAMFEALCSEVGVDYATSTFTNSTHSVSSVSLENTEVTAKDILKWIAEAACSFARMTRDGKVELGWFGRVHLHPADSAEETIAATKDADINSYFADSNYGASNDSLIGYDSTGPQKKRTLMAFDMGSMPDGVEIISATLHLYQNPGISTDAPIVFDAYRVIGSWEENTVTWNNQPAVEALPTIAGLTCPKTTEYVWRTWDITELFAEMVAQSSDSIMLRLQDESGAYREQLFESADSANAPFIEVLYGTAADIPETQCFKIDAADYNVAAIDKLEILSAETSINAVVGVGTNSYVIVNNPFLKGVTSGDVAAYGTPIYNKLAAFPTFKPLAVTAVCDWSIQAGDIISVEHDGNDYALPIYTQTIIWKGDARVSYESTGSERRPVMDAETRKYYAVEAGVEESVKQGKPYNNVSISHEDGFVAEATIEGQEVTAKFNAAGAGWYDSDDNLIGGMAVINSILAMIAGVLANSADSDVYATVGDYVFGGYSGIAIHDKSSANPEVPVLFLGISTAGFVAIAGGVQFDIRDANGDIRIRMDGDHTALYPPGGDIFGGHAVGVDGGGPYYQKNGVQTYF
jgi:hypothetical protein